MHGCALQQWWYIVSRISRGRSKKVMTGRDVLWSTSLVHSTADVLAALFSHVIDGCLLMPMQVIATSMVASGIRAYRKIPLRKMLFGQYVRVGGWIGI